MFEIERLEGPGDITSGNIYEVLIDRTSNRSENIIVTPTNVVQGSLKQRY
jgi:hypothetical protein